MAKKKLQTEEDKQLAFLEEKKNLDQIESRIREIIEEKSKIVTGYRAQINGITIVDNSDRQHKIRLLEQKKLQEEFLNEYSSFIDSPYFGHLDMSDEEEDYSFYVGTKGLHEDGKEIILDWRSPMGRTFYDKQKTAFDVEGIHYDLSLRRAVDIQKAKLISVNTEYDSVNVSLDGEVIDPFLLSVLEDKRRNRKLTNIIRSIQQNQNEIIGQPLNESFIVQGCAGSGKTMILLHRLSFIAFNYPKTNFSRVCILTPNENFNLHIDDLSKELGLDKIKKYTVESFYAELINSRMRIDTEIKNGSRSPKISVSGKKIESEKLLNDDMLHVLYSDEFYDQIVSDYNEKADNLVSYLNKKKVCRVLRKYQYKIENVKHMDFRTYSVLINPINSLIRKHDEAKNGIKEKENELETTRQQALILQNLERSEKQSRDEKKAALVSLVNDTLQSINAETETKEALLKQTQISIDEQLAEKNRILAKISEAERMGNIMSHSADEIMQSESFLLNMLESLNRQDCMNLYEQIRELRSQAEKVPVYNFGKRRRINREIEILDEQFRSIINEVIAAQRMESGEVLNQLKIQGESIDKSLQDKNVTAAILASEISQNKRKAEIYNIIRNLFETEGFPDLKRGLSSTDHERCEDTISVYEASFERYNKIKKALATAHAKENRLDGEIGKLKEQLLEMEDYQVLVYAASELTAFDFARLYEDFQEKVKNIYNQYQVMYPNKILYRHQVYLMLLLCTLYYGAASNTGYYLHIDEAQDLARSEYRLLKLVLGDKTVFNIYGDVNQAIYDYKGIEDWDDIMSIIPSKLFFLNENYRNTIEITDYCNRVFGAEVTAIGLHGASVQENSFTKAILSIEKNYKTLKPRPRTAIIYKRGLEGLDRAINETIKTKWGFNRIDESMISVLTIEEAKGLEFDTVLVIRNHMTVNEEYIAFTRALDHLIITELKDTDTKTDGSDMVKNLSEYWE